jgi:hypothetical protein
MRYRIFHLACACSDREPVDCVTVHEVVVYLWGRVVHKHSVQTDDCTYRFWTNDLGRVEAILTASARAGELHLA